MEPTEERRVLRLPVAEIRPNPRQPRRFSTERGLRELATSIRRHGIIQPLTVRRAPQGWELVAGERRLRAAKLAGLETVPCIEAAVDDRESALLALVENLQRRDLHYFEEATAIADYLRQSGVTQEEAAALLGRSPSAVANKLRLLRLSPACREILVRNRLSERHARCLLRLEDEQERLAAARYMAQKELNVTQAEQYIERRLARFAVRPPRRTANVHSQGCPAVSQQSGPGSAADSGSRRGRPERTGGDRGCHRFDHPHSETAPSQNLKFLLLPVVTGL